MVIHSDSALHKDCSCEMDNLDRFLEEHTAKVAKERACLEEEEPPYMTIKTKSDNVNSVKENAAPFDWASTQRGHPNPGREESSGLSLQLGAEYEQKKQKLKQELRLDYRRYMAQKKDLHAGEPGPQAQGLSLPIGERRFAKDKLRDERNKEYNLFLNGQSGQIRRLLSNASQVQAPETVSPTVLYFPPAIPEAQHNTQLNQEGQPWERLPSRRNVATLTDRGTGTEGQAPRGRRHWEHHRPEESLEHWERRRPRRRSRHRDEYNSEEEEEEEFEFLERGRSRWSREPEYTGRRERRIVHHSPDRVLRERREVEPPVVHEENFRDRIRKSQSVTPKPNAVMPAAMKTAERSRSAAHKDKAQFFTGLMIGETEGDVATQRRKDRYRQELLEQMAEGQRNKKKEKDLELRVAATGAIDPEKQPDRIMQFGAVNREYEGRRRDIPYRPGGGLDALGTNSSPRPHQELPEAGTEERGPPGRPRVAFPSPPMDYTNILGHLTGAGGPQLEMGAGARLGAGMGVPGGAPLNEDFHRSLSSTLGEIVAPRIASLPPPLPPTLTDAYRTPYDEAYYYYGARNPLDKNLLYYGPQGGGGQPMVFPNLPPGMMPPPGHQGARGAYLHAVALPGAGRGVGAIGERPKQSKESVLNYKEALRQQIQEGEERKRQEREKRDRYDAKIEAEMKAYDPWGKGGGGAPLKDDRGNLISDLNRMHRINKEVYVNPESRDRRWPPGSVGRIGGGGVLTPRGISGFSFAQTSQFARSNVFSDQPTPQQLQDQDTYKDYLKQQIEEKRRKEAKERDRERMEEEREEKRLAEQRVLIQQEFEEEQQRRKRKEVEQSAKNEELIRQAEERRKEADRKSREEEERESKTLRQQVERERYARKEESQRDPSPPIPALQKRLGKQHLTPRPPSAVSQLSSRALSERSMSAPHSPPVPARRNQLRATEDQQQGVISELSTLRRQLRSEQRRLEGQLLQSDREETDTPISTRRRGRPHGEVFEMALIRAQGSSRRPNSGTAAPDAHVNMQNIREFNQLKYRDSASREEVHHVYPDPPSDEHSLDIQQQALLREQQRRIRNMRRGEESDFFETYVERQPRYHPREKPGQDHQRVSLLESESAFIDYPNGDAGSPSPTQALNLRSRQPLAQERESRRPASRRDFEDDMVTPGGQREDEGQLDAQSLFSVASLNIEGVKDRNQRRIRRLDDFNDHNWRSGGLSADEGDHLSLRSTPYHPDRCVSVETVATEPWLRPGTSDPLKRLGTGQNRRERPVTRDILDGDGPSTYHG
ncbi:centrosome and spindle pole-associated protein 1 isoform X2 [Oncorhynchus keta]|uniref:centrosome and spindle pole-associated protein 1 isoform X2 n=1 Tax=Oncorhynchus keta TaxID=8018 RepID=UPI0015F91645|nr:centrosome and spindle pole-associated protein 1 isoform X2 [Oncorhynchus keta]